MKSTYNNPNLIRNNSRSDHAELVRENDFLKEIISGLLAFIVVGGIAGSATIIIFLSAK